MLQPPNWDNQVKYSNSIIALRGAKIVECKLPPCLLDCFEIYNVDRNHPAFPGRGVRATKQVENDSVIAFYAGILRPGSWGDDNPYVFGLEPVDKDFVIDAGSVGNMTRFINDPRGTLYEANLCAEDTSIVTGGFTIRCVQFRTTQTILVGQEVFFAYEAGHEGYWKPPIIEVIDLTQSEMMIIKRERQAPKRPRDQEEQRRLKPPLDFVQSVNVPQSNDILTLTKGNVRRRLQLVNSTLIIQDENECTASKDYREKAAENYRTEVAILLFWGFKLTHIEPGNNNTILGGSAMLD